MAPAPGVAVVGARHPTVQRLRRLSRRRSSRSEEGRFVVDGPVLLAEALDAGVVLEDVVAEPGAPAELLDRAAAAGARVHQASPGTLARATDTVTPQPVAAVARLQDRTPAEAVAAAGPLALVLVGVADPGNAGTLLRSAEAAGAGAVAFCDSAVDPYGPKCVRASAGSLFRLAVVRDAPVDDVLVALRAGGVTSVATVPTDLAAGEGAGAGDADPTLGAVPYDRVDLASRPVAVLLGNEAHGLHPALTVPVDRVVTIPMAGATESLNVAMAGTIVCFESLRQRRLADGAPGPANRLDGAPPRAAGCSPT